MSAGAVALAVLAGCAHSGDHGGLGTPRAQVPVPPSAPALTTANARALSSELAAGRPSAARSAIAMPAGQALAPSAAAQLASLGAITFDQSTFHVIDARDATVIGHIEHPPAGDPATWNFVLSYVGGSWKITDAEPRS